VLGKIVEKLLGAPVQAVTDFLTKRAELKLQKQLADINKEISTAQFRKELIEKNLDADISWESLSIQNSGWKDEYVLILISLPLPLAFVPYMQPYITEGFAILQTTPEWYRWLVMLIFTAIYGIRVWRR
jgi:hypothetical protein